MASERFLIAPFNSGLQTDLRPWLVMDDAMTALNNAYIFRGRVRKRPGSQYMGSISSSSFSASLLSRLRINVGTTDGSGNLSGTVPGAPYSTFGEAFSIGSAFYTAYQNSGAMLQTVATTTATFNITTGAFVFAGAPAATIVYFYPGLPVMGLTNFDQGPINNQPSYAFDTRFAYVYSGGWVRSGTGTTPQWHGGNANFFWSSNWHGIVDDAVTLFVSNFYALHPNGAGDVTDDPIWTFDGTTWTARTAVGATSAGIYFLPGGNAPFTGPYVKTAKIIVPFKDRLVLLNTIENDNPNHDGSAGTNSNFTNRCRYSHNGSPFAQNAWYEPNQSDNGGGANSNADGAGFIDAPTEEQIVGAEFIKDRLIVFFERSTWELAYTGNQVLPFVWQKINTELGVESTFSTVPFDKAILGVSNVGVHSCNGVNVERIDQKIPQQIFKINNQNSGPARVAGVRDYFNEMVYWAYPSDKLPSTQFYPNKILAYNYQNGSWASFDDTITAFGYFEQATDVTWSSVDITWAEYEATWDDGLEQATSRQVIAGNQQGYVFVVNANISRNAAVMQITNMAISGTGSVTLTIMDHTLAVGDYISVENPVGISLPISTIYPVTSIINANQITIFAPDITGTYEGGGISARVSNLGILSKEWNPYIGKGYNFYLSRIDFCVERTENGEVLVDYFPSSAEVSMVNDGTDTNTIMGTSILETRPYDATLYPLEQFQERLWHPIYFQSFGEFIQIYITFNGAQITNPSIAWEDFQLEGIILHVQKSGARLQ